MSFTDSHRPAAVRRSAAAHAAVATTCALMLALALAVTPAPTQAQAGCRELIVNGGFENGHDGWVEYSSQNFELIDPFYPRTGAKGAWLTANNNEEGWLAQTLVLPADAASLNLSYWWSIFTEENPGGDFDFLRAQLLRVDNTLLATLATHSNDSAADWVWNLDTIDVSAYAGQSVKLRFHGKNDANNPTSFFVDDVSLLACPEANTPTPTPTATNTSTPAASTTPTATPAARLFLPLILR